jgi:hypothetical protein
MADEQQQEYKIVKSQDELVQAIDDGYKRFQVDAQLEKDIMTAIITRKCRPPFAFGVGGGAICTEVSMIRNES